MAATGKLKVISAVLKQPSVFKAPAITTETMLSRQLVYKHLQSLVDEGYLERDGTTYCLVARNDLLDSMVDLSSNQVIGLLEKIPDILTANVEKVNAAIESAVIIRSAGTIGYTDVRLGYQQVIDDAINELKKLKRYLNSKQYSQKVALARIEREREAIWKDIKHFMKVPRNEWDEHTLELEQKLQQEKQ